MISQGGNLTSVHVGFYSQHNEYLFFFYCTPMHMHICIHIPTSLINSVFIQVPSLGPIFTLTGEIFVFVAAKSTICSQASR